MPTGWFRLEVRENGRVVDVMDERNAIVVGYRDASAAALAGQPGAVTQIGFGTGTTPAVFGNTGLTNAFLAPVNSATLAGGNSGRVTFGFSLASGDANGLAIAEFGLLTAAGVLVARKVRRAAAIQKNATISLAGTWTIEFAGA